MMKCPFLKETRVKFCQVSPIRKMIIRDQESDEEEKCTQHGWNKCPLVTERLTDTSHLLKCPFLQESLVQYCSISSTTKFIPYNEAPFSRCSNRSFRYCEHFLESEKSHLTLPQQFFADECHFIDFGCDKFTVLGDWIIPLPSRLSYASNHMWLDQSEDGLCYIGVDAFFTKVIGSIESVNFVTTKGIEKPRVEFTVRGVQGEVVFPNPLVITGFNSYLRAAPERIVSDPYGKGWLFEGMKPRSKMEEIPLMEREEAQRWMREEIERLSSYVYDEVIHTKHKNKQLTGDDLVLKNSVALYLKRNQIRRLFYEFFSGEKRNRYHKELI